MSLFSNKKRRVAVAFSLILFFLAIAFAFIKTEKEPSNDLETARRVLPGYTFVFADKTNVVDRCRSRRAFLRQHELMEYLAVISPYVESYHHPTNHPIMIRETNDRVILELPSRVKFPPYNWTIYWGSPYYFKMEIDKNTKRVLDMVQG